ncbi:MAG: 2Fe-2S iron-sulfur cluster binding domain-containing protein [Proteobacteria bacterium]|nr:2Fe-2S iron-sulfur cluster binding domain-containing protein [Pseudomonadota bacterium]
MPQKHLLTRRLLGTTAVATAMTGVAARAQIPQPKDVQTAIAPAPSFPGNLDMNLDVNGRQHRLSLDPRTTLLDALRDHLGLTGTKKGCDHGQCGACTVLINGVRMNSCLSLAASREGDKIVTIEGLADGEKLHPMQTSFVHADAFQCGFCTPGQICSAVGMANELKRGVPSAVTIDVAAAPTASVDEVRERMSGNICRCSAYPNIVAAILAATEGVTK